MEDIKEGVLLRKEPGLHSSKWREKYFVLNGHCLYWYKNTKEAQAKKRPKPKGQILLNKATIKQEKDLSSACDDAPVREFCFQVVALDGTMVSICASNEQEFRDWVDVLEAAASGRRDLNRETVQIEEELKKAGHNISPSELEFENGIELGKGASGVVRKGLWLKSTEVAVKVMKNLPEFIDKEEMTSFYKEIEMLSKLRHLNIVEMYGFCRKDNQICLVTEYVRGGNLADCLENEAEYDLNEELQIKLALNISRGMVFLHNKRIIHRDLKPENILVDTWREGKVKVCDFGLSKIGRDDKNPNETLGTPQYAAPELSSESHDKKVDVFSFSIVLWEISERKKPWPELNFGGEFAERYKKGDRPSISSQNKFRSLIESSWNSDPSKRPCFVDLYADLEKMLRASTDNANARMESASSSAGAGRTAQTRTMSNLAFVGSIPSTNSLRILPSPPNVPVKRLSGEFSQQPYLNKASPNMLATSRISHTASVKRIVDNSSSNGFVAPIPSKTSLNSVERQVSSLFFAKPEVSWDVFAAKFSVAMSSDMETVNSLRFVFETQGVVSLATWNSFLSWFSPLTLPSDLYETTDESNDTANGYDIKMIREICSPLWFHGFLGSQDAHRMLKGTQSGTFLMRFSTTNPGSYALSASYSNNVGHWRIICEKKDGQPSTFRIDNRTYRSLANIIEQHGPRNEPLKIKTGECCFLEHPFIREKAMIYEA